MEYPFTKAVSSPLNLYKTFNFTSGISGQSSHHEPSFGVQTAGHRLRTSQIRTRPSGTARADVAARPEEAYRPADPLPHAARRRHQQPAGKGRSELQEVPQGVKLETFSCDSSDFYLILSFSCSSLPFIQ